MVGDRLLPSDADGTRSARLTVLIRSDEAELTGQTLSTKCPNRF